MNRSCILWLLILSCFVHSVSAQYVNVWAFGSDAGIDFNTNPPAAITTSLNTSEGSASICNAAGQLLFYTDGYQVWDRNNDLMPNGNDLTGVAENVTASTSQGALIVPMPGNGNKYYLFSLGSVEYYSEAYFGRLSYSVVDMTLHNGLGDVVAGAKGVVLDSLLMEQMVAVSGTDCNIWLIAPTRDTFFKAYSIDESGIDPSPVLSYRVPGELQWLLESYTGCLSVSPDGSKLALSKNNLVLYDFDIATGVVSNPMVLDANYSGYYGAAFSADNSKLYTTNYYLKQFNLSSGSPTAIINSQTILGLGRWAMRLAPNGKIYVSSFFNPMSVINQPDLPGVACDYDNNAFPLSPGTNCLIGLPNYTAIVTHRQVSRSHSDTLYCLDSFLLVPANTNGTDYVWDDGSAGFTRMIYSPGNYSVHYKLTTSCMDESWLETFHISVSDEMINVSFLSDSLVCEQQTIAFQNTSSAPYNSFAWSFGDGTTDASADPQHTYGQPADDTVMLIATIDGSCPDTAYKVISVDPRQGGSFQPDQYRICTGAAITFITDIDSTVISQNWQFGDGADAYIPTAQDTVRYSYNTDGIMPVALQIHFRACPDTLFRDTITVYPFPIVNLSHDTALCLGGSPIHLENLVQDTGSCHYQWNTGDTTKGIAVKHPGTYTLTVTQEPAGCATTDAVAVKKDCYMDIPNAFTPNGDGANDYFFPRQYLSRSVTQFRMQVLNRWGQKVFETTNIAGRGWDGRFNGKEQPAGVYVYIIDVTLTGDRQEYYEGNVTLLR